MIKVIRVCVSYARELTCAHVSNMCAPETFAYHVLSLHIALRNMKYISIVCLPLGQEQAHPCKDRSQAKTELARRRDFSGSLCVRVQHELAADVPHTPALLQVRKENGSYFPLPNLVAFLHAGVT
eukprot:GHVR01140357.1.p1 GENE.GHVR01140357.1~~GHVR01140357.1.p1  ORF type:complete len:125 (+),score=8.93 GHVR01140357.1:291-665(+)